MKAYLQFIILGFIMLASTSLFAQSNAPTALTGSAAAYNQVNLSWKDNSTNETKFEIERKDFTTFVKVGEVGANVTTYQDKTAAENTTYIYRVRAGFATNFSGYSNEFTVATPLAPPGNPTGLVAVAQGGSGIKLTWNNGSGSTPVDYQVERGTSSGGPFTLLQTVSYSRTPTSTDVSVLGGSQYCYRVRSRNTGGTSGYSNVACATMPLSPTNVRNLAAQAVSSSSIKLTWDRFGKETGIGIERRTGQTGNWSPIATTLADGGEYTDTGLNPSTEYCYRISQAGYEFSSVACATTQAPPPPIAPSGLSVLVTSDTQLQIFWNDANVQSVTFELERATKPGGPYTLIASNLTSKIYDDKNLSASSQYCYRVRAKNSSGGYSGYSNEACGTTKAPPVPNAPARLTAIAVSSSQINLQWADASDNETGFQVERASNATAPFTKIADLGANATTYSDQSLQASTQYCYRVRAINGSGGSSYTDIQCATTQAPPVGAPQNLVATAASTTQINLTWSGVSGATAYQLERSPNGNDNWTKLADPAGNATIYSDAGLTPNTRYYYRLRAVVGGNARPYSNVANAITPDTPPAAPARLTATLVSFSQINLAWADLSNNESGFQLERSPNGNDSWTKIADLGTDATSYSDQGLSPQTHYYYRVRAVNAAGPSPYSNTADATTPVGPPGAPQNLVATAASTTQINLSWTAVATATNVLIERSLTGTDGWAQIASVAGDATSYTDAGLAQNTRYYYRIRGANASGNGPYSAIASAITPDVPPAAPARLTATAISATQINLTWADLSTNEASFDIERSADGTSWTKIGDAPANATSFQNTGLTPNTKYYYRIRAVNAAGPSPYSNTADATTPDVPPTAPANLTATPTSATQISLSWSDQSANETGFEVERGNSQTGSFTKIADLPANTTTYQDQGLTPAVNYCYRVRAKNTIGASGYSNTTCAATPDVPPVAPARLTATAVSTSQINLAWADLSTNENGFEIERGNSATGTFTKIADAPANATVYEDKNLTDNTQYCYRVRAKNAAGPSAYTDAACATTPLAPPATPTNLAAQVFDYDQIKLTWAALGTTAVTVVIERATNPNGPFSELKQIPASQTSYVDMGLQEFTTYYYRIKALNTAGSSGYSNVATARVEEVIIAVEDELETHTTLFVSQRTLHIITNWFTTAQTTVHLHTANGNIVLTDNRKVRPADRWDYNLDALPTGLYIINIVADGRKLAKRILVP